MSTDTSKCPPTIVACAVRLRLPYTLHYHGHLSTQNTPSCPSTSAGVVANSPEIQPPWEPSSLGHKLDVLLEAIEKNWTSLENKIDNVAADLTLLHVDQHKLVDKVHTAEQTLAELQLRSQKMEPSLRTLENRVHALESRAEDVEGRSRRNNDCIVSLPVGTEGQDAVAYVEH
ncbi:hypothetical protein NDU88_004861 [Pleurodeles waltl]|uniref:Uncharacterized protein n=1 Tax=Pleurodeles waltl TaxID=8319 RepID=A0AAV7WAB7_PLEWA|nr:hypothetical protein NDU88_004861 [Pleurodeles waltl]